MHNIALIIIKIIHKIYYILIKLNIINININNFNRTLK